MGLIGESLYGLRRGEFGGFKGRNNMCRNDLRIQVKSRDLKNKRNVGGKLFFEFLL